MADIVLRNELMFDRLTQGYRAINPMYHPLTIKAADLLPQHFLSQVAYNANAAGHCLKTKDIFSEVSFYAQEAYFAKGTVNHIVHAGQSQQAITWITRNEYFNSLVENWGDFQKEVAHWRDLPALANAEAAAEWATKFIVTSSKYIARLFDAHHRVKKVERNGGNVVVPDAALTWSECAFPAFFTLQKQVRNKTPTVRINRIKQCAVAEIIACINTALPARLETERVLGAATPDRLTKVINKWTAGIIGMFYRTSPAPATPIPEVNNGNVALDVSLWPRLLEKPAILDPKPHCWEA